MDGLAASLGACNALRGTLRQRHLGGGGKSASGSGDHAWKNRSPNCADVKVLFNKVVQLAYRSSDRKSVV